MNSVRAHCNNTRRNAPTPPNARRQRRKTKTANTR